MNSRAPEQVAGGRERPFAGVLALAMLLFLGWATPGARAATEEHIFDPTLSLTGRCTTEELDPVADPWCPGPPAPSAPFESPNITIDGFGDMYVASYGKEGDGHIDVFNPDGAFITEFSLEGPQALGVDGKGNLYVLEYIPGLIKQVSRFSPTVYKPTEGEIEYGAAGSVVIEEVTSGFGYLSGFSGLTVDPTTGKLFVSSAGNVGEWSSAEEGNALLDGTIGQGTLSVYSKFLAVDVSRNRLFVTDGNTSTSFVDVFELKALHKFLGSLNGAKTPNGKFISTVGWLTVDADESTGHIFVSDLNSSNKVYEFGPGLGEEEEYLASYQHKFKGLSPGEIAIDNSLASPNEGTLYVPSGGTIDHTYAFRYVVEKTPVVESISFSGVTETEAVLRARINPEGVEATYGLEYTTQQRYEEEGFANATVATEGKLAAGIIGQNISATISGLEPGTSYRFRVYAVNGAGEDESEATFRTYGSESSSPCSNETLRSGLSARLLDCRAYELVSPSDTNGRTPLGLNETGIYFPTLESSPDGNKTSFRIQGGSLPGSEGSGAFNGENYLATREPNGWSTKIMAPSGAEALAPLPGSLSPDQEYSFWSERVNGEQAAYLRYPDGHSEFVGQGSLGTDPHVSARLISEGGGHVIFATMNTATHSAMKLEEQAPPEGTTAVYDRTADGITHVVSLLPGGITPAAGQNAVYVGASFDGMGIAFRIGETLYFRYRDEETYEVGKSVSFAGVSEGGARIFYVEGGDLFAIDAEAKKAIQFTSSGDVTPVNVSADGGATYFISPSVLTGEGNPNGAVAQAGKDNLYLSNEGAISFVGTVTALDVSEKPLPTGEVVGLGQWLSAEAFGRPGRETSRATPDGRVLVFESRAPLTGYDPEGRVEIYRYDLLGQTLTCLSCNPTDAPAGSDASLVTIAASSGEGPVSSIARVSNLRADGRRAFFESSEPLVKVDTDGVQDVYEWEEAGVGSCQREGGCVYLVSSGQSARDNYLYSVSESGNDVFFVTSDRLLGSDSDATPSIYDARVNGGFPESQVLPCQGEGCYPAPTPSPTLPTPATPLLGSSGNVREHKCPKGKHKVTKNGKTRCVKNHHKRKHRRVSAKNGGGK